MLWLVAVIVLLIGEMVSGDLVLLMLGGGALAAAGADFLLSPPLWADGVVFAVVSVLLLAFVRPVAKRHMLSRPSLLTNTEALEGKGLKAPCLSAANQAPLPTISNVMNH